VDILQTDRLRLRRWEPDDAPAMAEINRHPEVGRYLNRPVDAPAIAAFHGAMVGHWETHGYGPWALESRMPATEGRFVGFAGLAHLPPFLAAVGPAPELGWRLAPEVWGLGLATEAAAAARDDALRRPDLDGFVSIIHPANVRSQRVAQKLDMRIREQVHNPVLDLDVDVWAPVRRAR